MAPRYGDTDMSRIAPPDALLPLDYEARRDERLNVLADRLREGGVEYDVETMLTDSVVIAEEHAAYLDVEIRGEINDAVKAVMLATSWGSNLDHLGAGRRTARLVVQAEDPETNTPAVMEDPERYRRRIQLAPDTWAAEGPLSSYEYFGLDTVPLAEAIAVYDFRHKIGLKRGHILVVVLPFAGDDPEAVRSAVRARLHDRDIAPGGKLVEVVLAKQLQVNGKARLLVSSGPEKEIVKARAHENLSKFFSSVRGFFPLFSHSRLTAALQVEGVKSVVGVSPENDIDLDHRTVAVMGSFDLQVDVQ